MSLTDVQVASFHKIIYDHFDANGRHDLPWRTSYTTPYHVFISEMMLQQTGVDRVIPKFLTFVTTFPTLTSLAQAPQSEVLAQWVGLGYNRRALYIHRAAQQIAQQWHGQIPSTIQELRQLPGIGPYAAASIAAFAYDKPEIVIDTNIRTVFIHHFFADRSDVVDIELVPYIEQTLDYDSPRKWYSALMDYGTYLKKTVGNITRRSKHLTVQSPLRGSRRELRGAIIKLLTTGPLSRAKVIQKLTQEYPHNNHNIDEIIDDLTKDGLIKIESEILTFQ